MCMSRSLPSLILVTKNQLAAGWLTGLLTLPSKQRKCDHICRRTGHRRILPRCNCDRLITRYNFTLVQIRPSGNTPPYHRNRVWPRCSCCSIRKKKTPRDFLTLPCFRECWRKSANTLELPAVLQIHVSKLHQWILAERLFHCDRVNLTFCLCFVNIWKCV